MLSHSNFGSSDAPSAMKMRETLDLVHEHMPDLEVDGEMHGDCALDEAARKAILPGSALHGSAGVSHGGRDAANGLVDVRGRLGRRVGGLDRLFLCAERFDFGLQLGGGRLKLLELIVD